MSRYRASLGIVAPRGLPDDAQSPRLRAEPGSRDKGPRGVLSREKKHLVFDPRLEHIL